MISIIWLPLIVFVSFALGLITVSWIRVSEIVRLTKAIDRIIVLTNNSNDPLAEEVNRVALKSLQRKNQ